MSKETGNRIDAAISSLIPAAAADQSDQSTGRRPGPENKHIVDRLQQRYGLGPKPNARLSLYQRIQLSVDTYGEPAYRVVSECVLAAEVAGSNRHLYFCKAVKLRLIESGMWPAAEKLDW